MRKDDIRKTIRMPMSEFVKWLPYHKDLIIGDILCRHLYVQINKYWPRKSQFGDFYIHDTGSGTPASVAGDDIVRFHVMSVTDLRRRKEWIDEQIKWVKEQKDDN